MKITNQFKVDTVSAFKHDAKLLKEVVSAIENKNENKLRILLERSTEEPRFFIKNTVNRKVKTTINPFFKKLYNKRMKLYSQFMDSYTSSINKQKVYDRTG